MSDGILSKDPSRIRDYEIGRDILLTAHIHMITPCRLDPPCKYCSLSSYVDEIRGERDTLTIEEIVRGVRLALKRKEITSITLVGGTDFQGQDDLLLKIIREIRKITDIEIAIDVGAPISVETLEIFKEINVPTVYSSLETVNEDIFHDAKPGDSFKKRQKLLQVLDDMKMNIGTIIMNGLGSSCDVINSIHYLKRFRNLKYLYFSTFTPVKGTPWELRKKASVTDTLNYLAASRIALPKVNIGLADVEIEFGSISDLIMNELENGGGNTLAGMLIYKNRFIDYVERMLTLEEAGYHIITRND